MSEFRHVHRATPLLRFWTTILAIFAALLLNLNASGIRSIVGFFQGELQHLWWLVGSLAAFVLGCAVIWWASGLWWRAMGFALGDEEVAIRSGVVSTRLRTARYDRIQAVDVVEPVIARMFRVAKVRIETAGGNDSALEILYLSKPEAEAVRSEVLTRVRGEVAPAPEEIAREDAPLVPAIPVSRSIIGAALHAAGAATVVTCVAIVFVPGGAGAIVPIVLGLGPWLWGIIDRSWGFTADLKDDSLVVAYGLADKRRQTIPLDRIHAVKISQPILWRLLGWWQVTASVAGYGIGDKKAGTTTMLPVGTREQAIAMVAALSPLEAEEVIPEGAVDPTFRTPRRAWWLTPVDRAQQAVTVLGERAVILHGGRLSRRMMVIAPAHIQELSLVEGPIAQLVKIANVRLDLVRGPVIMVAHELAREDAQALMNVLRKRRFPALIGT